MTRKTPSATKRELEKLRRRRNGDGGDGPREVVVELGGVPAHDPAEDGDPPTEEDVSAVEWCTVNLETGEVERPETPEADELPECRDCGLNPAYPGLDGECEACAGMPARDWRPVVRENEAENESEDDHE